MMRVTLNRNHLSLQTGDLRLEGLLPQINNLPVQDWQGSWAFSKNQFQRSGAVGIGGTVFGMQLDLDQDGESWILTYWLEGVPPDISLDSFGIQVEQVYGLKFFLRSGYYSWDGSTYLGPPDSEEEAASPLYTGYGLTQLIAVEGRSKLVLGFDRHDRFQQSFSFLHQEAGVGLKILTHWDRKDFQELSRIEGERLLIIPSLNAEAGLLKWAARVARFAPTPPRGVGEPRSPLTGWSSWYNLYAAITEDNIREHLQAAAQVKEREGIPLQVFQIDDGITPEMGDWLEVKPQFPNGMKSLLDEIRRTGFIPGLWIAPFMVGNRSHLYARHPDWVVQDAVSGGPLVQMRFYGEFRWHKRSEEYYILDITNPEAYEYIRKVFTTWREEWGCEYFKTDFMHFGSEHGPDRATWHTPGMTRIDIWRRMGKLIRECIGETFWLGCGCPLWASIGLVDAVRIGRDTGVEWNSRTPAMFANQAVRNFGHGILWQADPDVILLRSRFHHFTNIELEALAIFAGLSGGLRMTSDHLGELSPERLGLWKMILGWTGEACRYPFLERSVVVRQNTSEPTETGHLPPGLMLFDPLIVQVKEVSSETEIDLPGNYVVFLLNAGETAIQRVIPFDQLGNEKVSHYYQWRKEGEVMRGDSLDVELQPHEGKLFFVSGR